SIGRRARRLIGAPTAPLPPRCAIRPRARAARLSPARRDQAGDGLPPLHAAGARNGARRVASVCAAFNLRRLRALGVELAQRRAAAEAVVGCDPARSTSRERGRRRSAYEASERNGRPCPSLGGAESKRRRRPRSRGPQSWVALLVSDAQRRERERRGASAAPPARGVTSRLPGAELLQPLPLRVRVDVPRHLDAAL